MAEEARKVIEGDLVRGAHGIGTKDLRMDEAIRRFLEFQSNAGGRRGRGVSPSWLKAQTYILNRLAEHSQVRRLAGLSVGHIERYLGDRGPKTQGAGLAREWGAIRTFIKWAWRNRYLSEDISTRMKGPQEPPRKGRIEFLPREDCERLLKALQEPGIGGNGAKVERSTPLYELACVAFYAGLRVGEITMLRWRDVDLKARMLHVRPWGEYEPKDEEGRPIPMPPTLVKVLAARRRAIPDAEPDDLVFPSEAGTPYIVSNLHHKLVKIAKRAGLKCNWYGCGYSSSTSKPAPDMESGSVFLRRAGLYAPPRG